MNKIYEKIARVLAQKVRAKYATDANTTPEIPPLNGMTNCNSVYWIGHSLMQETVTLENGDAHNLFNLMASFAEQKGCEFSMFDHTLYGSPMSLQWRGCPHSYQRLAPEIREKRENFERNAAKFDALVITEIVPVSSVIELEYSDYYLAQFCQTFLKASPNARLYLYESWDYLDASRSDDSIEHFDWAQAMAYQRSLWERIANNAMSGDYLKPKLLWLLGALFSKQTEHKLTKPIYIVPVGQVFLSIFKSLKDKSLPLAKANGEQLEFYELFTNAFCNRPKSWPLEKTHNLDSLPKLKLHHPEKEHDDIHPSAIGIYIVALTHFACLYRSSPEGVSSLPELGDELSHYLQTLVWKIVSNDARSGVQSEQS